MKRESHISNLKSPICDLCGATSSEHILTTERLDGPLVKCTNCELYFVVLPERSGNGGSQQVAAEMARLAERASDLSLVDRGVEDGEQPWRELTARERLDDLKRYVSNGRLLEIGSSTGEMLKAASQSFTAIGIEPDQANWRIVQARGLACRNTTLMDARFPDAYFDIAASYHVIEHVPSPRAELRELHRIVKPGGWLVMETPNIANLWYRLLGARWRQFIPDHIFFFTPLTSRRICEESGFEVVELRSVGKAMSARLFISRMGRFHKPTAQALEAISDRLKLGDRTLRLRLGDVMRVYARRLP